tara:strand:+ start:256 stop:567 length:312 start_codon:yes stop_codon:yes gene_type:complete
MNTEKQKAKYTIKLFHNAFGDKDKYVANWEFDEAYESSDGTCLLEVVYQSSQNIDESWSKEALGKEYRSTSVGDYMELNGVRYYVGRIGFTKNPVNDRGREIA